MAKSKSILGGKSSRKEQTGVNDPASIPNVNPVALETAPVEITPEPKLKPEPRKLEVVKTEPRKNVLPIKLEEEIRRRAYELYQQRGTAPGSEAEDWLTAEREVRQRYRQQSA